VFFDEKYRLSRKRFKMGYAYIRIANGKSQVADQSVSVPMTLSVLERPDATGQIFFPADLCTYARIFWSRTIKFGTEMGHRRKCIWGWTGHRPRVSHAPSQCPPQRKNNGGNRGRQQWL